MVKILRNDLPPSSQENISESGAVMNSYFSRMKYLCFSNIISQWDLIFSLQPSFPACSTFLSHFPNICQSPICSFLFWAFCLLFHTYLHFYFGTLIFCVCLCVYSRRGHKKQSQRLILWQGTAIQSVLHSQTDYGKILDLSKDNNFQNYVPYYLLLRSITISIQDQLNKMLITCSFPLRLTVLFLTSIHCWK